MRSLALLTALAMAVPAVPTIASAQSARVVVRAPDVTVNWNRERYDRYEGSRWHREFRGRWTPLATGYNARSERQFINLGGRGAYRKLRIEGVRGEPVILKIAIEYADRTNQAVEYREALPRGAGEVIDLNGDVRRINRIIVYTDPGSRGSYSVYGA
jgi:hypothetical protein